MTVLEELLDWSRDRPRWQRDALRRLVVNGELSDDDIRSLSEICKGAHGLSSGDEANPLTKQHVPERTAGSPPVSLHSIFHHCGVNALAEDQTLRFGPRLTVVYGDNAAGKTGYIRILKNACRARGQEKILGNVVSGTTPLAPVVSVKYTVGSETVPREWAGTGQDEFISRVSVFDTQCASVYLTEKTDVAFRPFGLDLFDQLVKACKAVRAKLETEQRALSSNSLADLRTTIPEGTGAARFLAGISSLTTSESVQALPLTPDEEARLTLLEKSLVDLQSNDPERLTRQLSLQSERAQALTRHLKEVESALSASAVTAVLDARAEGRLKSEEAKRLREATFPTGMLTGTGSEQWTALWEAARRFSNDHAYPEQTFPVIEGGARCVLCQQDLDPAAANRLNQFESFVISSTEQELRDLRERFVRLRAMFTDVRTETDAVSEALKELRMENENVAEAIGSALSSNEARRMAVMRALKEDKDLDDECPELVSVSQATGRWSVEIAQRIQTLRGSSTAETRKSAEVEVQELRARKSLAVHSQRVLAEIERRKRFAAYGLCIDDTRTQAITQKSSAVTKRAVSQRLKQSFGDELVSLRFRHVEVELKEVGGEEGVLYHRLILSRAPGVELPKVVSEGEQRCLSIAAFFAELSTAEDPSGIVFDDPVSSLDYRWRENVARRLVKEAATRQVIVFTHDVVFLLLLKQFAKEAPVPAVDQHVRQLPKGAGVCEEALPWVAMPVSRRIGHLKKQMQAVEKLFRDGHQAAYEKDAKYLYGLLREAWERALEEVLLEGVVERFRPGVQTKHIVNIADTTEEDCRVLDSAMTKCSKWVHDQAAAAPARIPEPSELREDIEGLEKWVNAIRKRRGSS